MVSLFQFSAQVGSVTDGLPLGCSQVCRQTGGSSGSTDAWAHLNLRIDQLSLNRWDFRIIHWDKVGRRSKVGHPWRVKRCKNQASSVGI